ILMRNDRSATAAKSLPSWERAPPGAIAGFPANEQIFFPVVGSQICTPLDSISPDSIIARAAPLGEKTQYLAFTGSRCRSFPVATSYTATKSSKLEMSSLPLGEIWSTDPEPDFGNSILQNFLSFPVATSRRYTASSEAMSTALLSSVKATAGNRCRG